MKRIFLITFILLACCTITMAQQVRIAFFSYDKVLHAMPDYALAEANVTKLRQQYQSEMAAAEKEFSEKYELFLEQQASLAPSIREKRQQELEQHLDRNMKFRKDSERLLHDAEHDAIAPLRARLDAAIQQIGKERVYLIIYNTDTNALPYIDTSRADDVTEELLRWSTK